MLSITTICAETKIEIFGDQGYAPYAFAKNGKMEGIYTQVIKEADRRMENYSIVLKPIAWKQGLRSLKTGKIATN